MTTKNINFVQLRSPLNLGFRYLLTTFSPKLCVKVLYFFYFHKRLDLKNPHTLDEKIQWMKLNYYRGNELVKRCADKYRVRDYIKECGLEDILVPLLHTYKDAKEINWDELPDRFVLKWNFGCGGNVVCSDKSLLDTTQVERDLSRFKRMKAHMVAAEPQYDTDKVLLCEQFINTADGNPPTDYKVYCFNGRAEYVLCCYGRAEGRHPQFYFFNPEWELQRFNRMGLEAPKGFTMPKPEGIERVFECAEILSKPFPFVRADFYLEGGKVYFGELTFTPAGGFDTGRLPSTQLVFGEKVVLPTIDQTL